MRLATLLRERGTATSVHELIEVFGVSEATLRRDLAALSETGELVRVYGGAAPPQRVEFSWHEKAQQCASSKLLIAKFAAEHLVRSGDVVFVDAGTTPAAVARQLAEREDVTLVVAGLSALIEAADAKAQVVVLGGRLRRPSASFLGTSADLMLDLVRPDVAFLGTDHLDPEHGANYPDLEQAAFKSRVIRRSDRSWMVVDASKFDGPARFRHWAALDGRTGIVTVRPSRPAALARVEGFRSLGCAIHLLAGDQLGANP